MTQTLCPGCGLKTLSDQEIIDTTYNASSVCLQYYWELSSYTLSLYDDFFIHQYVVDAYAAQHANASTKPIKTAFALIGLYLAVEHGYTGKQVQQAHTQLAHESKYWPFFLPSKQKVSITVLDAINASDEKKDEVMRRWIAAVWELWKPEQTRIAELAGKYLSVPKK